MTGAEEPPPVAEVRPPGQPPRRIRRRPRRTEPAAILAEANLPVDGEPMKVIIFGLRHNRGSCTEEVVALVHEDDDAAGDEVPLVRVHSACLTGDIFGSQKCDCGAQLRAALHDIRQARRGALLYMLTHEGRGIGLASKIRAYHLQDEGLDTIAANVALGLPVDARDYAPAAAVLLRMGITTVDLLTNNPDKIESLLDHGVTVRNRIPIGGYVTPENAEYLEVKDERMGHLGAAEETPDGSVTPIVPIATDRPA